MDKLYIAATLVLTYVAAYALMWAWEVCTVPACKEAFLTEWNKTFGGKKPPPAPAPASAEAKFSSKKAVTQK